MRPFFGRSANVKHYEGVSSRYLVSGAFKHRLMCFQSLSVTEREEYTTLVKRIADATLELSNFTKPQHQRMQIKLSPMSTSENALLLLRIGETERGWSLLELLLDEEKKFGETPSVMATGFIRQDLLDQLFEEALREHDINHAAICLEVS